MLSNIRSTIILCATKKNDANYTMRRHYLKDACQPRGVESEESMFLRTNEILYAPDKNKTN